MKNLEFAAVLPFAQQAPMLPAEMLWSSHWTGKVKLPLTILRIL